MSLDLDQIIANSIKPQAKAWHWTDLPDPIPWIEQNFYLYDTRKKFKFFPVQIEALNLAMEREPSGAFVYQTVLFSWIKKSAKSTLIAALAHWLAMNKPSAQIALIANDLRQAQSRVGFYLRQNIFLAQTIGKQDTTLDPAIFDVKLPRRETEVIEYPNGSHIEMLPTDPSGEAGGNHDMLVLSELWGWNTKAHQDMFAEMTLSPTKYGQAQRWIDTYAGFEGESVVLENLYNQVVKPHLKLHPDYEFYGTKSGSIFATWVTQRHFPWQTDKYYESERRVLTPNQFARMHENKWATSAQSLLPDSAWWSRLEDHKRHKATRYTPVIVGIDAGITSDCFAIVVVSLDPSDEKHKSTIVQHVRVWYPHETALNIFKEPAEELRRIAREYNVIQFCYDPTQMEFLAHSLYDEGWGWFEDFHQGGGERAKADKLLYDMIREKRIHHFGQSDMAQHINNANKDELRADKRLLIVQRNKNLKIDAVIALSMANARALEWLPL